MVEQAEMMGSAGVATSAQSTCAPHADAAAASAAPAAAASAGRSSRQPRPRLALSLLQEHFRRMVPTPPITAPVAAESTRATVPSAAAAASAALLMAQPTSSAAAAAAAAAASKAPMATSALATPAPSKPRMKRARQSADVTAAAGSSANAATAAAAASGALIPGQALPPLLPSPPPHPLYSAPCHPGCSAWLQPKRVLAALYPVLLLGLCPVHEGEGRAADQETEEDERCDSGSSEASAPASPAPVPRPQRLAAYTSLLHVLQAQRERAEAQPSAAGAAIAASQQLQRRLVSPGVCALLPQLYALLLREMHAPRPRSLGAQREHEELWLVLVRLLAFLVRDAHFGAQFACLGVETEVMVAALLAHMEAGPTGPERRTHETGAAVALASGPPTASLPLTICLELLDLFTHAVLPWHVSLSFQSDVLAAAQRALLSAVSAAATVTATAACASAPRGGALAAALEVARHVLGMLGALWSRGLPFFLRVASALVTDGSSSSGSSSSGSATKSGGCSARAGSGSGSGLTSAPRPGGYELFVGVRYQQLLGALLRVDWAVLFERDQRSRQRAAATAGAGSARSPAPAPHPALSPSDFFTSAQTLHTYSLSLARSWPHPQWFHCGVAPTSAAGLVHAAHGADVLRVAAAAGFSSRLLPPPTMPTPSAAGLAAASPPDASAIEAALSAPPVDEQGFLQLSIQEREARRAQWELVGSLHASAVRSDAARKERGRKRKHPGGARVRRVTAVPTYLISNAPTSAAAAILAECGDRVADGLLPTRSMGVEHTEQRTAPVSAAAEPLHRARNATHECAADQSEPSFTHPPSAPGAAAPRMAPDVAALCIDVSSLPCGPSAAAASLRRRTALAALLRPPQDGEGGVAPRGAGAKKEETRQLLRAEIRSLRARVGPVVQRCLQAELRVNLSLARRSLIAATPTLEQLSQLPFVPLTRQVAPAPAKLVPVGPRSDVAAAAEGEDEHQQHSSFDPRLSRAPSSWHGGAASAAEFASTDLALEAAAVQPARTAGRGSSGAAVTAAAATTPLGAPSSALGSAPCAATHSGSIVAVAAPTLAPGSLPPGPASAATASAVAASCVPAAAAPAGSASVQSKGPSVVDWSAQVKQLLRAPAPRQHYVLLEEQSTEEASEPPQLAQTQTQNQGVAQMHFQAKAQPARAGSPSSALLADLVGDTTRRNAPATRTQFTAPVSGSGPSSGAGGCSSSSTEAEQRLFASVHAATGRYERALADLLAASDPHAAVLAGGAPGAIVTSDAPQPPPQSHPPAHPQSLPLLADSLGFHPAPPASTYYLGVRQSIPKEDAPVFEFLPWFGDGADAAPDTFIDPDLYSNICWEGQGQGQDQGQGQGKGQGQAREEWKEMLPRGETETEGGEDLLDDDDDDDEDSLSAGSEKEDAHPKTAGRPLPAPAPADQGAAASSPAEGGALDPMALRAERRLYLRSSSDRAAAPRDGTGNGRRKSSAALHAPSRGPPQGPVASKQAHSSASTAVAQSGNKAAAAAAASAVASGKEKDQEKDVEVWEAGRSWTPEPELGAPDLVAESARLVDQVLLRHMTRQHGSGASILRAILPLMPALQLGSVKHARRKLRDMERSVRAAMAREREGAIAPAAAAAAAGSEGGAQAAAAIASPAIKLEPLESAAITSFPAPGVAKSEAEPLVKLEPDFAVAPAAASSERVGGPQADPSSSAAVPALGGYKAADSGDMLNSFETLWCRRCFIYDCKKHGLKQPLARAAWTWTGTAAAPNSVGAGVPHRRRFELSRRVPCDATLQQLARDAAAASATVAAGTSRKRKRSPISLGPQPDPSEKLACKEEAVAIYAPCGAQCFLRSETLAAALCSASTPSTPMPLPPLAGPTAASEGKAVGGADPSPAGEPSKPWSRAEQSLVRQVYFVARSVLNEPALLVAHAARQPPHVAALHDRPEWSPDHSDAQRQHDICRVASLLATRSCREVARFIAMQEAPLAFHGQQATVDAEAAETAAAAAAAATATAGVEGGSVAASGDESATRPALPRVAPFSGSGSGSAAGPLSAPSARMSKSDFLWRVKQISAQYSDLPLHVRPCNHSDDACGEGGSCGPACPCVKYDMFCEAACGCTDRCANRYTGCRCTASRCGTQACPCFQTQRECDPDLCRSCECEVELDPVLRALTVERDAASGVAAPTRCGNVALLAGRTQPLLLGRSATHGWGAFLGATVPPLTAAVGAAASAVGAAAAPSSAAAAVSLNGVAKNRLIGEYTGELISHEEADRRGKIYDKLNRSYLFNLNDHFVVDAARKGNKMRFANHSSTQANMYPRIVLVRGEHRIGLYARRRIAPGEELLFDYKHDHNMGATEAEAHAHTQPHAPKWFQHAAAAGTHVHEAHGVHAQRKGAARKRSGEASGGGNSAAAAAKPSPLPSATTAPTARKRSSNNSNSSSLPVTSAPVPATAHSSVRKRSASVLEPVKEEEREVHVRGSPPAPAVLQAPARKKAVTPGRASSPMTGAKRERSTAAAEAATKRDRALPPPRVAATAAAQASDDAASPAPSQQVGSPLQSDEHRLLEAASASTAVALITFAAAAPAPAPATTASAYSAAAAAASRPEVLAPESAPMDVVVGAAGFGASASVDVATTSGASAVASQRVSAPIVSAPAMLFDLHWIGKHRQTGSAAATAAGAATAQVSNAAGPLVPFSMPAFAAAASSAALGVPLSISSADAAAAVYVANTARAMLALPPTKRRHESTGRRRGRPTNAEMAERAEEQLRELLPQLVHKQMSQQ